MEKRAVGVSFQKILVPVDFSPCSQEAFRVAAGLARQSGAVLTILHVIDEKMIAAVAATGHIEKEKVIRVFRKKARELFHEFLEKGPSAPIKRKLLVGVPFNEILKTVRLEGTDLVVMGRYGGTSELEKIFFGSTAEKVVRLSPCAVLSIVL